MIFPEDGLTDPFRFRTIYGVAKDAAKELYRKLFSRQVTGRTDNADIIDLPIQSDIADDKDVVTGVELPEITDPEFDADPEEAELIVAEAKGAVDSGTEAVDPALNGQTTAECIGEKEVLPEDLAVPAKEESEETPIAEVASVQEKPVSILDNKPYVKVIEDLFQLSSEMERIGGKSSDEGMKSIAEHVVMRLEEIFERNGLSPIDGETSFDVRRHKPEPASVVADGSEIAETLSPGWSLDERVMRRAKVRIASEI